ncbi:MULTISPECIES: MarR family transcriptional regulator [Vibrio]|uniref:MarR family transcriptional regulator n=2 Tax=Vibrio TaxID=662 RepID=A0A7X4RTD9_9VIBR|nr:MULTISPECIES: MarR family transcriptional regulator [Vibrio]MBF9003236.1 MarR family transcriptional regulator [Vibrio nitrifigilis]MZI91959.1 MarR family transcriptional regulator [Vibrio eleionomae]
MAAIDSIRQQWAEECPNLNTLPMGILGRMRRLTKYLETQVAQWLKEQGLLMGEFDVLMTLKRSGAPYRLTPSLLLESMMLTSGAMTNRLDKLEQKALISREHSVEDRRSVEVQLTEKGLALVSGILDEYVHQQEQLISSLDSNQQQQLDLLLSHWLTEFE